MPPLKNIRLERFAQAFLLSSSGRYPAQDAGRAVGYTRNTSRVMAARPEVKARIRELQEASSQVAVATEVERRQLLTAIMRHQPMPEEINARDRIYAIAELNKMEGSYAPEKHVVAAKVVFEVVFQDKELNEG